MISRYFMNWLTKYKDKLGIRYATFEKLFIIAKKRNLKIIVETGTARGKSKFYYRRPKINWKDGMSTLLFAEYADMVDGNFWSCDIDNKNIFNAYQFTQNLSYKVNFAIADSLVFLRDISTAIDILYLDSLDGNIPGANEHQLKEAQIVESKLNEQGLILLDDKGTKTELSIPFFNGKGWNVIFESNQQVLLSKK